MPATLRRPRATRSALLFAAAAAVLLDAASTTRLAEARHDSSMRARAGQSKSSRIDGREGEGAAHGIRLVLQVTVDQLRGDLAQRDRARWATGGFERLFDRGTVFADAHHGHANTETIVGHATLATGADPSVHGMVGNAWFDRATGTMRYNIEDPAHPIVGDARGEAPRGALARTSGSPGRSPEAMLAPSLGDAVAAAGGGRSRVFAVSIKDRGAVPMAGRGGKALWWSNASGRFVSSTFYFPGGRLPAWVEAFHARGDVDRLDGRSWSLLLDPSSYRARDRDDAPWEVALPGGTRTFPHVLDREAQGPAFYSAVAASPFGDEMLAAFARELIRAEGLGLDDAVDYLSVSFSSPDLVGHLYGPSSLEVEDQLLRLDRTLASLFAAADEAAGEGGLLVVLSADHGVAEPPAELVAAGRGGGRVAMEEVESSDAFRAIVARHGGRVVAREWPPCVYLDREALAARGSDPERVARELAVALVRVPGIAAAFTRGEIEGGALPATDLARAVSRSWHPSRSGDVYVVPEPGWQLSVEGNAGTRSATSHGSPWRYDTFVPLVFQGPGIEARTVHRRVETVDAAPTIAAILGIPAPASATGTALREVVDPAGVAAPAR